MRSKKMFGKTLFICKQRSRHFHYLEVKWTPQGTASKLGQLEQQSNYQAILQQGPETSLEEFKNKYFDT